MSETACCAIPLTTDSDPKGQWVHLMPAGEVIARDGRRWRNRHPAAVVARSRERAGAVPMPVDYEHQTDHAATNGQPAPAAGWITGLQVRTDGIWGLVAWTGKAKAMLDAKEYRFISPTFTHAKGGEVIAILRAALTNAPALELTALAKTGGTMEPDLFAELRTLLGLPADADMAAVVVAVRDLVTSRATAEPDPAKFVPIGDFKRLTAEYTRLNAGVARAKAEEMVETAIAGGKVPPFLKDWAVNLCTANKPAFDEFVAAAGAVFGRIAGDSGIGTFSQDKGTGGLSETELAVCKTMGHSPEDYNRLGKGR
ncbi:MAG: phage protease [Magnetospirillum sp. WYHS-4]